MERERPPRKTWSLMGTQQLGGLEILKTGDCDSGVEKLADSQELLAEVRNFSCCYVDFWL